MINSKPRTRKSSQMATFQRPKTPLLSRRGGLSLGVLIVSIITIAVMLPDNNKSTAAETGQALPLEINNETRPVSYSMASGQIEKAEIESNQEVALSPGQPASPADTHSGPLRSTIKLRPGDSLIRVLQKQQIDKADRNAIILANIKPFKKLVAGKDLAVVTDHNGVLQEVRYAPTLTYSWRLFRDQNRFQLEKLEHKLDVRQQSVTGVIQQSLFVDGKRAGLSVRHIMNLAEMFGWDIDFALDLRKGDRFAVILEEKYYQGKKAATGDILAAEFINRGRTYRAIAHRNEKGKLSYFTPAGKSLRRTFLRSPVKFSYISSRFTKRRYHPILKKWRAHKGVDYAARSGTPVRSTASGKIAFVGRKGGYGKAIIIKHGGSYSTLYAHLSRYQRRLRRGQKVRQGQIIGYVGSTGLASGPHLHYEFRVNNKHRNPLRFRFPKSNPIANKYKQEFLVTAKQLNQALDVLTKPVQVVRR